MPFMINLKYKKGKFEVQSTSKNYFENIRCQLEMNFQYLN